MALEPTSELVKEILKRRRFQFVNTARKTELKSVPVDWKAAPREAVEKSKNFRSKSVFFSNKIIYPWKDLCHFFSVIFKLVN